MRRTCIISVILVALAWGGCVQPPECPEGCIQVAEGEPIRLGVALALTGEVGDVGEQGARAVELAVEQRPGPLGFDVELLVEDSACTAAGGLSAIEVLEVRSGLAGLIGPSCSVAAVAILQEGPPPRPLISPSNTSPLLTLPDVHQPGYYRVAPSDAQQADRMGGYVVDTLGVERVVVIRDGSDTMAAIDGAFEAAVVAAGGVVLGGLDLGEDVEALATVLTDTTAGFVYLALPVHQATEVVAWIRARPELDAVLIGGLDQLDGPVFLAEPAAEGTLLTRFALDHAQAGYESFVAAWEARWDDTPSAPFHAHAWDATQLMFAGIDEVASLDARGTLWIDRAALRDALDAVDRLPALTGLLGCDGYGDCAAPTPVDVRLVQGGETVPAPAP